MVLRETDLHLEKEKSLFSDNFLVELVKNPIQLIY